MGAEEDVLSLYLHVLEDLYAAGCRNLREKVALPSEEELLATAIDAARRLGRERAREAKQGRSSGTQIGRADHHKDSDRGETAREDGERGMRQRGTNRTSRSGWTSARGPAAAVRDARRAVDGKQDGRGAGGKGGSGEPGEAREGDADAAARRVHMPPLQALPLPPDASFARPTAAASRRAAAARSARNSPRKTKPNDGASSWR